MNPNPKNIVIFSSCIEKWGGSEELWSQTAEFLAKRGYKIHIFKLSIDFAHPRIKSLLNLGCEITDLNEYLPNILRRVWNRFLPFNSHRTLPFYIKRVLAKSIRRLEPELIIISQGVNFDGLPFLELCPLDKFPYVTISQKAIKYLYPNDWARDEMKDIWRNAKKNYFVSQDNLQITQNQFGMTFNNAEVVRNPFLVKFEEPFGWDFNPEEKIKLACVGRLYVLDKGQDTILNVLAQEKWRRRNIEVSFYGKGVNEEGIKDLAKYLKLENVKFKGHVSDIEAIWKENQALVLPARNEGLPLVVVEAMMCGRIPIVTNVGGTAEVVRDEQTGFISNGTDEKSFDETLERAWQRRDEWNQIGKLAAHNIRTFVSENPAEDFADKLEQIIEPKPIAIATAPQSEPC